MAFNGVKNVFKSKINFNPLRCCSLLHHTHFYLLESGCECEERKKCKKCAILFQFSFEFMRINIVKPNGIEFNGSTKWSFRFMDESTESKSV
jgi:hypothetical protein